MSETIKQLKFYNRIKGEVQFLWTVVSIRKNVLGYWKITNFQKLTMTKRNVSREQLPKVRA